MAIRIPVVADVADWLRGTRKISSDLDDLSDDLRDLARDSDRSSDRVRDSFRDMADGADDAFDRIRREADRTGRSVENDLRDGTSSMSEVGGEVGSEFAENFGEAVRARDPAGLVTESLTSLAPALGGLGFAVAGLTGLVGGIIEGVRASRQAAAEQLEALADSWFSYMTDAARDKGYEAGLLVNEGLADAEQLTDAVTKALGQDEPGKAWDEVRRLSRLIGLDQQTVIEAVLGQEQAIGRVRDAQDLVRQAIASAEAAQVSHTEQTGQTNQELTFTLSYLDQVLGATQTVVGAEQTHADAVDLATTRLETQQAAIKAAAVNAWELAQAGRDYTGAVVDAKTELDLLAGALRQIELKGPITVEVIESVVRQDIALANRAPR